MPDASWMAEGTCSNLQDKKIAKLDFFIAKQEDKYEARAVCRNSCPVRWECINYALNNGEIWGIWGGVDEYEIRRALSVNKNNEPVRRARAPRCPYCAQAGLITVEKKRARSKVECPRCSLSWWIRRAPKNTPVPESNTIEE